MPMLPGSWAQSRDLCEGEVLNDTPGIPPKKGTFGTQSTLASTRSQPLLKNGTVDALGDLAKDMEADDSWRAFFVEKSNGQYVPRSVFMDTDFAYKEEILNGRSQNLFPHENLLAYKQDCKSNFHEGRTHARESK